MKPKTENKAVQMGSIDVNEFKWRKKPVIVEAFQWNDILARPIPDWWRKAGHIPSKKGDKVKFVPIKTTSEDITAVEIETLEGRMFAAPGDYIIKGIKGELYPCKPDIFEQTYEKVVPEYAYIPPQTDLSKFVEKNEAKKIKVEGNIISVEDRNE